MGGIIKGATKALGFGDAGDATKEAAGISAAAQREALEYLKEREAIPQQFREGALTQMGGLYGLEGGEGSQQSMIDQAMASPLYGAIMGGQEAGEDAILRHASMTGGMRSGDTQGALTDYGSQLQNKALLESYNQQLSGLQGLAQLPSNAPQIAGTIAGIGQTQALGVSGAAQADTAEKNQMLGMLFQGAGMAAGFSDIRLKSNIQYAGSKNGHNWYTWDWNDAAADLGLSGSDEGVMAHEAIEVMPESIGVREGYITVNYDMLGVQ